MRVLIACECSGRTDAALLNRCYVALGEQASVPTPTEAYVMGATGGPFVEAERLAFEAWMEGHCWALGATWNGSAYVSDMEEGCSVDPAAMMTRMLWAAWRDRAALVAHDVASVPDGFVMVPAEPTDAMKLAGNDALAQHWGAGDAYRAMLAASRLPVQPVQGMSNRSKRLDEIRAEAERFFEWPGDDRSTVTLTSCILFADHIAAPSAPSAPEVK